MQPLQTCASLLFDPVGPPAASKPCAGSQQLCAAGRPGGGLWGRCAAPADRPCSSLTTGVCVCVRVSDQQVQEGQEEEGTRGRATALGRGSDGGGRSSLQALAGRAAYEVLSCLLTDPAQVREQSRPMMLALLKAGSLLWLGCTVSITAVIVAGLQMAFAMILIRTFPLNVERWPCVK
eukprot:1161979-Pelagomonas_calceolata.AAC.17